MIEFYSIRPSIHTTGIKKHFWNRFPQSDNNKTTLHLFDQLIKIYNKTWYVNIVCKLKKKFNKMQKL